MAKQVHFILQERGNYRNDWGGFRGAEFASLFLFGAVNAVAAEQKVQKFVKAATLKHDGFNLFEVC